MKVIASIKPRHVPDRLGPLLRHGIRSFRINYARGDLVSNRDAVHTLVQWRERGDVHHVFVDLPGRKARLQILPDRRRRLNKGAEIILSSDRCLHHHLSDETLLVSQGWIFNVLKLGDVVSLGTAKGTVVAAIPNGVKIRVLIAGEIYSRCAIQVPGTRYSPSTKLVDDDRSALAAGAWLADQLMLSFADDVRILHEAARLRDTQPTTPKLIAKIESPSAIDNIDEIAAVADGLLLGRGDLSYFYTESEMDRIGELLLRTANRQSKPVVFATDYLRSLTNSAASSEPTAHEVERLTWLRDSEVAFLLLDETGTSENWESIARVASRFQV